MLKLRKILLCNTPYVFLLIVSFGYALLIFSLPHQSVYQEGSITVEGTIESLFQSGDRVMINLKAKENLAVSYSLQSKEEKSNLSSLQLGDTIVVSGEVKKPTSFKNFYAFSYSSYLKNRQIYFLLSAKEIILKKKNKNGNFYLKQKISDHIASLGSPSKYLATFLIGDKSYVSSDEKIAFQRLGISHLFALSGMHLALLSNFVKGWGKRRGTSRRLFIMTFLFLTSYASVTSLGPSMIRALVFTFFFGINKTYDLFISSFHLLMLCLAVLLFFNPYYLFDVGFQYSFIISAGLILYSSKKEQQQGYFISLLKVSFLSFLFSLPISLYHFSYVNLLSIGYNLFYVPFISFLLFPLAFLTFLFPFLTGFYTILTNFLDMSVTFLNQFSFGILAFRRLPFWYYILLFLSLQLALFQQKKRYIFLLGLFLTCHFMLPKIIREDKLYMIDIGQGDSFLFVSNGKTLLLDTGGVLDYRKETWATSKKGRSLGENTLQFLTQLGFTKLDFLILSHGDADHAKESLTLLDRLPIGSVFLNDNQENNLEQQVIKLAMHKKVPVQKLPKDAIISVGNFHFQVLSQDLHDENDSSLILFGTIGQTTMLFMGDASKKSEAKVLEEYNLKEVTILKVGHHGSKTSSSLRFLTTIRPQYALISSGENNKFGHPHQETMEALKTIGSTIYNTSLDGMVMFDFRKNKRISYRDTIAKSIFPRYNKSRNG